MRGRRSTAQRGYGTEHQKLRRAWKPYVDAGKVRCHAVVCLMPSRWIAPGAPWDLGHTRDRTGWTGPEHRKCNRAEGSARIPKWRRRRPTVTRRWEL